MHVHETDFPVRSYELDLYQHVNHAVYALWLEDARNRFLESKGRSYLDYPERLGVWIVVVSSHLDYRASARGGDTVRVRTTLERIGEKSVTFAQTIDRLPGQDRLVDGRVVMVFTDGESAVPVPGEFREDFG